MWRINFENGRDPAFVADQDQAKGEVRPLMADTPQAPDRSLYTVEFSTYNADEAGEIFRLIDGYVAKHGLSGVIGQSREAEDGTGFADIAVLP